LTPSIGESLARSIASSSARAFFAPATRRSRSAIDISCRRASYSCLPTDVANKGSSRRRFSHSRAKRSFKREVSSAAAAGAGARRRPRQSEASTVLIGQGSSKTKRRGSAPESLVEPPGSLVSVEED
jgi:hypothetical protein